MIAPNISVYLDTRRKKDNEKYPVKLRVYHSYKTRYYPTGIDLTKAEFAQSQDLKSRPRGELKKNQADILAELSRAASIAESLNKFNFDKFEKKLLEKSSAAGNVFAHYESLIKQLHKEERIKTAINYKNSQHSIKSFLKDRGKVDSYLSFSDVTVDFLEAYERYMIKKGRQTATVGIYLRPLRALFNSAIEAGEIGKELYPFTKKKYQIPGGRKIKKAIGPDDLKKIFFYPVNEESPMFKARAFWFFCYQASGMNIKDVAELREKNISEGSIIFIRSKTSRTTKSNPKPIVIPVTQTLQAVINMYGNQGRTKDSYIFPILNHSMIPEQKERAVGAFTRFVNQHIKKLALLAGVEGNISNMHARHSYVTVAIQRGASKSFVQDQLGHQSLATTENYFKGFDEKTRNEIAEKIMDFTID
jgi:integrase/recombinase XerD